MNWAKYAIITLKSYTESMQERFILPRSMPIEHRMCAVSASDLRPLQPEAWIGGLLEGDSDPEVDAIIEFTEALLNIPPVEAVTFLAAREAHCPTTLAVEIFAHLEPGNDASSAALDAITDAHAKLNVNLLPPLRAGLRLVNLVGCDFDSIKQEAINEWSADPILEPLRTLVFQRESGSV